MMRRIVLFIATLSTACLVAQDGRYHDSSITNVSAPRPQQQVFTDDEVKSIYTQQQALDDLKKQVDGINESVVQIRADVETLKETNSVAQFLIAIVKYLVPGLLVAWFSIWYSKRKVPRKPVKATAI